MTLLAPAFLFGLLAIGVPIWLHRLSSENPNRQPFSSVMFLEPGEPRRVLAKKLKYLLLFSLLSVFLKLDTHARQRGHRHHLYSVTKWGGGSKFEKSRGEGKEKKINLHYKK